MHRVVVAAVGVVTAVLVPLALPVAGSSPFAAPESPATRVAKAQPKRTGTYTGCVDEQDGVYVLIDDGTRKRMAALEASGFPQESLAKYLGHKINVRGEWAPNGNSPVIKVRSVATLNSECAPTKKDQ